MGNAAAQHVRNLLLGNAMGSQFLNAGRMSVSGTNILDENGHKWCMRGFGYGEFGLTLLTDPAEDASLGANCVRMIVRAWGGGHLGQNSYSFPNVEGESVGAYGDWDPTYLANILAYAVAVKRAGLKLNVAFDSNCGQNGSQSNYSTGCSLFDGSAWQPAQNFWTTLGAAQKLPGHLNRIRMVIRTLRGLVDFCELLAEPNPPGLTQLEVNNFYLQAMAVMLAEDPAVIPIVGGFLYSHGNSKDPFTQGTVWPCPVIATCNFLDSVMSQQADSTYTTAVADLTSARSTKGVPVISQQVGTQYSSEVGAVGSSTDSLLLASGLAILRDPAGDGSIPSIGWTMWEKVSKTLQGYGPWNDTSNTGNARGILSQNRINTVSAAMRATPIFG